MRGLRALWSRVSGLFGDARREREFAEELESHLQMHIEDNLRAGMSAEEARREAALQLGGVERTKQAYRERSTLPLVESLLSDLRFAIRQLGRNRGFAVVAIVVLALGIGVSVAIFGFVDAALLEPLPYANPGRLMSVNESSVETPRWPLSYPEYVDWQRLNKSFSSLDVYSGTGYLLRSPSGAEPVQAERVSGGFFRTLGVRPMLGRDFYADENRPGGPDVLLLSYGAWLHRFDARSDVVGRAVDLDGRAFTIIGVLPRSFSFAPGGNAEFWVPLNRFTEHEKMRGFYNFWGIGRLRDGVAVQTALAEMTAIAAQLQRQYGKSGRHELSASVIPLTEVLVGDVRPILLTLLGGAGLLLLIACVNVASLVLVRSESRRREIAVRGALGATPLRLVRQFVMEGLLLALLGCSGGVIVAAGMMKLLGGLVPKDMASKMPFLSGVGLNAHTGIFAFVVAVLAGLLLAATPALRLSFQKVCDGLADGDRGAAGRLWRRLGANLVVVELAVAVVLLAGAGLLGQSLYRLLHVPLGFEPNRIATVRVMVPDTTYTSEQTVGLYREIVRRISGLPGVESVGMTSMLPVECNCTTDNIHFPGKPDHGEHNEVDERHVSTKYLATLKAGLVRGRFFVEDDDASKPGVVVINQALARKYFAGEDPIGQRIANEESGRPSTWEIVGVVDDVREGPLDVETWPAEYFPISQTHDHYFSVAVRTGQDPSALLPELVSTLHGIDPNLGVSDEWAMEERIGATQAALLHRFSAWLVGGFAAMALVLGVVGLYGVIAYSVSQRTREIGVRMALGAQRGSVYGLILKEAGRLIGVGIVAGLVFSVGATTLMRGLLFGVSAWDAPTLIAVAMVLAVCALLASYIPARRAASVNPVEALRAE
jgi:macrolide transport system ATP-binding/permease protein